MEFNYPKNVHFKCDQCALCCGDTPKKIRTILLLKTETDHISQKVLIKLNNFAEKIEGFEPYAYRMKKTKDGKCVFLKDNLCSIYEVRPLICRFYPFQLKSLRTNRYVFEYTTECPGIGKGPQLKKEFFEELFKKSTELIIKNSNVA
jgi:hypothetical protein